MVNNVPNTPQIILKIKIYKPVIVDLKAFILNKPNAR